MKRASFGFYEINFKCWHFCALVKLIAFITPTPPLFYGFYQCNGCLPSFLCRGRAHGCVVRICQPWDWSPSRSWLPIVEAPGCPQAAKLHTPLLIKGNRSRSRHNVEGFFCRCTIFRLAKPAFFRYNENFTLGRGFYVAYFVIPEISKNN